MVATILWYIWKARNDMAFNSTPHKHLASLIRVQSHNPAALQQEASNISYKEANPVVLQTY